MSAYERAEGGAQKADIFRLAFLHAEGGFYADADDRCLAPLSTLVPDGCALALYQEDYGTLGNNFIAAVPGHPVIGTALENAVLAVNRGDRDTIWLSTGPGLITRAFTRHLPRSAADFAQALAATLVLSRRELHSAVAMHCHVAYKRTAKHWMRSAFGARPASAAAPTPRTAETLSPADTAPDQSR